MQNIPNSYINPKVSYLGISKLRSLNAAKLRESDNTLVIQENEKPLAVVLKYEEYLSMQERLMTALETLATVCNKRELDGIMSGVEELKKGGKSKTLEEIQSHSRKAKEKA